MRDEEFTLSNLKSTDAEVEGDGLKVKGHGLWTSNVTVGKTEI